jgi:TRAP-type C4-dicarboxylate transport system substrate-binding protein
MLAAIVWVLTALAALPVAAQGEPIRIRVVGGLADVRQFVQFEEPFWRRRVPEITGGRLLPEISAFDRSGIRGQEMLQLMRLGVVPFGTALLALVASEEPELNAADLPAVSPDMPTLRRTVAAYRPHMREMLANRYDVELLGVYTYPAQVIFCRRPFTGLADLAGRRIRTSSVAQSEVATALGAIPVVTPFAEMVSAMRTGGVECAITGTLSANAVGLHEVSTHMHSMAITWGLSIFGANRAAWNGLPEDIRAILRQEIARLEERIWEGAAEETGDGIACNAGAPECRMGRRGRLAVVPVSPEDEARRRSLLTGTVLPGWVRRCGNDCVDAWNDSLGQALGIRAAPDRP